VSNIDRREFVSRLAVGGSVLALWPDELAAANHTPASVATRLADGWRFHLGEASRASQADFDDQAWASVTLPHTARVEAVVTGAPGTDTAQWQGICWYRRRVAIPAVSPAQRVWLRFGGAMNVAEVYVNGTRLAEHWGGFTPFVVDITDHVTPGQNAQLAVRLDNTDNPVTGPKPLADLDFNTYGGLYRHVDLVVKPALHITDPQLADRPGSGGVLVTIPDATADRATVRVQLHLANRDGRSRSASVRLRLVDATGRSVAESQASVATIAPNGESTHVSTLDVVRPSLWSPRNPALYSLRVELLELGRVLDAETVRVGIRRFALDASGLRINGEPTFLRGTNRHQEYPYIGYALSDEAQYRDAKLIKDAGFDYIRLSHYLHAPAFMDACDELGLVVMNCIPGWQYFNRTDPRFTELQYQNIRAMIRRDRNHACVLLWETSLNETEMPPAFIARSHAIGHEELPGDQCFTCGWSRGYDVFIQARQHGGCVGISDVPCVVSEYGDWEYYAQNAGLNQTAWANLAPDAANSRQLRWHGEARLLQQATNFQEAYNDNRKTTAFADGLWVMFDYNRGYAPDIESSGCADLFRIPKPSYHFFRSQRDARDAAGPVVHLAWSGEQVAPRSVRVFANVDEVELRVDGRSLGRQRPDRDRLSTHLAHPPFTFALTGTPLGSLEAVGYLGGAPVARHLVRAQGEATQLTLRADLQGRAFAANGKDAVFLHAELRDAAGTLVTSAWENVAFGAVGPLAVIGANPYSTDAGIASALLQSERRRPRGAAYALSLVARDGAWQVLTASLGVGAAAPAAVVRATSDGSPVTPSSPRLRGTRLAVSPSGAPPRVAMFVGSTAVAALSGDHPRFHVAGSTAPTPSTK
jgi:beta-galactosidase